MSRSTKSSSRPLSRRQVLKGAAGAAVALAAPYVKAQGTGGTLTMALWDHWVPGANEVLAKACKAWGKKNNVEVKIDFITSLGNKMLLTSQAEARAKKGHDIFRHTTWYVSILRDKFLPVDDVIAEIEAKHGKFIDNAAYLAKLDGNWKAVPAPVGSHTYPMVSRVDYFKQHAGVDLLDIFPVHGERDPVKVAAWNYDNFLTYATKLNAAGHPFGNPIGPTSDSQDWLGPLFASFGSTMIDANGEIQVDSDETRVALEYMKKLTAQMPRDVYAWDDAGNNRWLISGRGSCIQNPPSAWAVARRDAPEVAENTIHHDTPAGPAGRFRGGLPNFWGIWEFAENKTAAKELIVHLADPEVVHKLLNASMGFDMPLLPSYRETSRVWEWASPPAGALHSYPIQGDERVITTGWPAPPPMAAQIYAQALIPNLVARVTQGGESMDEAIKWAGSELEGFQRG